MVSKEFIGISMNDLLRDWPTWVSIRPLNHKIAGLLWRPSPWGILKINFDSSSFGIPGPVGFGIVFRNCTSHVRDLVCRPLGVWLNEGGDDCTFDGPLWAESLGVYGRIVEGDSVVVMSWGMGKKLGPWYLAHFIMKLEVWCRSWESFYPKSQELKIRLPIDLQIYLFIFWGEGLNCNLCL